MTFALWKNRRQKTTNEYADYELTSINVGKSIGWSGLGVAENSWFSFWVSCSKCLGTPAYHRRTDLLKCFICPLLNLLPHLCIPKSTGLTLNSVFIEFSTDFHVSPGLWVSSHKNFNRLCSFAHRGVGVYMFVPCNRLASYSGQAPVSKDALWPWPG